MNLPVPYNAPPTGETVLAPSGYEKFCRRAGLTPDLMEELMLADMSLASHAEDTACDLMDEVMLILDSLTVLETMRKDAVTLDDSALLDFAHGAHTRMSMRYYEVIGQMWSLHREMGISLT